MNDQNLESQLADRFSDFINSTLEEVEAHLNVPVGTVSSMQRDEDYLLLIKVIAVIEPLLNDLIRGGMFQRLGGLGGKNPAEHFGALADQLVLLPLNGRPGRLQIASALRVISDDEQRFIEVLARMRNGYAHNIASLQRPLLEVFQREASKNEKLLSILTFGMSDRHPRQVDSSSEVRSLILISLTIFLSIALRKINEPEGNIFEGILNMTKGKA